MRDLNEKERADLKGFIAWAIANDREDLINPTISHDLEGIFQELPCFAPRSSGYAKYLPEGVNV